jgi:hypothetical protein
MPLQNYRDLSTGGSDFNAGFQFEFSCASCGRRWRSPFRPYRMGQITGFLSRFAFLLPNMRTASRTTGNFADFGSRGARDKALSEAMTLAERVYRDCPECRDTVCEDCFDARKSMCKPCVEKAADAATAKQRVDEAVARDAAVLSCPNCRTPHQGGRFCAECGFDMASTHKTCPGCGAMMGRNARFCTDCGHSF